MAVNHLQHFSSNPFLVVHNSSSHLHLHCRQTFVKPTVALPVEMPCQAHILYQRSYFQALMHSIIVLQFVSPSQRTVLH